MSPKIHPLKQKAMQRWHEQGMPLTKIAQRARVSSSTAYMYVCVEQQDGNGSSPRTTYQESWARHNGFPSYRAYQMALEQHHQTRRECQELSHLIEERLQEIGRTKSWLAEQVGITRRTIQHYANGRYFPKPEVLERLYEALGVEGERKDESLENVVMGGFRLTMLDKKL